MKVQSVLLHWHPASMPRSTSLHWTAAGLPLSQAFLPAWNPAVVRGFSLVHLHIRQIQQVLADVSSSKHQKKKKLRRLERVCLCQAPENHSMAIFKNCLFQIIDENTSVKNMINVLQTINVCLIHSCLVDVYRSQIPYRRVICWLVYFWFIPFYTAEGQNQYFARRAISTNNKQRTTLSVWPTVLRALPSKFF